MDVAAIRTQRSIVFYVKHPGVAFYAPWLPAGILDDGTVLPVLLPHDEASGRADQYRLLVARTVVDEMFYNEGASEVVLIEHLGRLGVRPASPKPAGRLLGGGGDSGLVCHIERLRVAGPFRLDPLTQAGKTQLQGAVGGTRGPRHPTWLSALAQRFAKGRRSSAWFEGPLDPAPRHAVVAM